MNTSVVEDLPEASKNGSESQPKSKRFRFKRREHRSNSHHAGEKDHNRRRHSHRHHHHRSKKRKLSSQPVDDPSAYDDSVSGLPPDAAFRESLFDAMGDDEGAAFWEGVYGQPIHTYPNTYQDQDTGELDQMNDEEYAQFVRRKMWEKSWEGIEAAKEEKRREREEEKQTAREEERTRSRREVPMRDADYLFDLDVDRSLRRGERRRDKKRWKSLWEDYLRRWVELQALREVSNTLNNEEQLFLRNKIAWPVESGKRKDVNLEEIERFIRQSSEALDNDDTAFNLVLKSERVRWHPDKIQQLYGFMNIDESTLQGVTAVFQAFDHLWNERRGRT